MKKFFLSFSVFSLAITSMSQQVNYIPYYHLANKAKLAQCAGNYDSAIIYYQQAFEMVDYILMEELQNFTRCAALNGKDSLVYYTMNKCIAQTVPLNNIFIYDTLFDKYKNTEKWNECVAKQQENTEKYKEKFHNSPHKRILDSLIVSDQEIRNKWNGIRRAFPNSKRTQKLRQENKRIDSCNQLVLDEMIKKYDFPNERNGLFNNLIFIPSGVVLIHYDDTNFLRNVEYKALIEGKLSPDYYAMRARRLAFIFKIQTIPVYHYRKEITPEEKEQVNKNRYEIGLPSVEEEEIIRQCDIKQWKAMNGKRKK